MNFTKVMVVLIVMMVGFTAVLTGAMFLKGVNEPRSGRMDMARKEWAGTRQEVPQIPLIGDTAPSFVAETTQGQIKFPEDYKGKWVILFSHPADFTPVCTTEFMMFASMMPEFKTLNCELIGLSIGNNLSHIAWLRTIHDKVQYKDMKNVSVTFPLIADMKMEVANKYGMIHPLDSDTKAVRAVFFIDPLGKIRALIYYPRSNGRNLQEIKRLLIAMQTSDRYGVATPADWQPGDDVIISAPRSSGAANDRVANPQAGTTVEDWFLTFKKMPKSEVEPPAHK